MKMVIFDLKQGKFFFFEKRKFWKYGSSLEYLKYYIGFEK